jgi:hypothetical protein
VAADIDEDSERALGVLHAVWTLRDAGKLYAHEEDQHHSVRGWFDDNLEHPTRFTAAGRPFYRKKSRAISWFKDTGFDCWRKVGVGEILGCAQGASAWCHRYSWLAVSP